MVSPLLTPSYTSARNYPRTVGFPTRILARAEKKVRIVDAEGTLIELFQRFVESSTMTYMETLSQRYNVEDRRALQRFVDSHRDAVHSIDHAVVAIRSLFPAEEAEIGLQVAEDPDGQQLVILIITELDPSVVVDRLRFMDREYVAHDPLLNRSDVLITVGPV